MVVSLVHEQKHLGLTLQSDSSFEKHNEEKMRKEKQNIGILKRILKYTSLEALDHM